MGSHLEKKKKIRNGVTLPLRLCKRSTYNLPAVRSESEFEIKNYNKIIGFTFSVERRTIKEILAVPA